MAFPGDAPALFELFVTPSGGAAAPIWAAVGWWPAVDVWNRCWNGDFESDYLDTKGWSVAAVTNINGAANSITRITTAAKYGTTSAQIVCPATSGTGASFRIFRDFKQGVTYTAELWVHAAAAVTSVSIRLGNGAANDSATSAGSALSTTWKRLSVTWTPSADRDNAHVAVIINAATLTTFEIDGVMVYEGTTAPTSANQSEGRGGFPPVGLLEAENSTTGATANANFRGGFGSTSTPTIIIDPSLLTPDDYTANTVAIEVWGRTELTAGVSVTATLSAIPVSASPLPSIYSEEFGTAGKALTLPSAGTVRRFVRLGTLRFPTDGGRYGLKVNPNYDYFMLLPANSRALSPSGRANDASYPQFVTVTSEVTRRIRSDGSGTLREPAAGASESAAPGLGGALLEMQTETGEVCVKLSNLVPDDPTSNTADEQLSHAATVHFRVTPRWRLGRSS